MTSPPLLPHMAADELVLFRALLGCAERYAEFGCGGSTVLAAELVGKAVVAVDGSPEWMAKVAAACEGKRISPTLMHADIGPTGDWGVSTDPATRSRWPLYHQRIWTHPPAAESDLVLVDGRFRIACFLQALLLCRAEALIAMHDYEVRPAYHVVERFARPVAKVGELAVFQRRPRMDVAAANELLIQHAFDPA